jgi:hypothetical protein
MFLIPKSRLLFLPIKGKAVIFFRIIPVSKAHALAAQPLLLLYPRMYVRRLFLRKFSVSVYLT